MYVFVCNFMKYLYYRGTLMTKLEHSLERKKIVFFSLWEDIGVL